MYKKGDVQVGEATDTQTDNYDTVYGAYLPHSWDSWVIGGSIEIRNLIIDLSIALKEVEAKEKVKP